MERLPSIKQFRSPENTEVCYEVLAIPGVPIAIAIALKS
jgi:hypothetical protein